MKTYTIKPSRLGLWLTLATAILCVACSEGSRKWRIGVSQCSEDIWRHKQNSELVTGGYVDNAVELEFLSADDSDERQIEQVNHFIDEKVDLLIVAPNSAASLTPVIDKAYDSGIPVILFDRRTNSEKYTAYISADNYAIGNTMGKLIANDMQGKGTLVEITGLKGSSPAIERHRGFLEAISHYPQIKLISSELGDWTEESGGKAMAEVLEHDTDIDRVFGHNDRLALGARKVALSRGLKDIKYYGVDALPTPGGGIEQVLNGVFEATYIYPTQGLELMRLARKILNGGKYDRHNKLHSAVVDRSNAELLMMQYRELQRVSGDIETIHGKVDEYFSQVNLQQKIITAFVIVLAIIIALAIAAYRFYLAKVTVHEEVANEVAAPFSTTGKPDDASATPVADTFLDRFRSILQQHLHDADFNVERIGGEMGMSRVQLYRKIKSLTGMTPVELLRKARVARGRQLLESTDRSVSEIAYDVGFTAPSYFAKCFKDEYGMSPGEARGSR